MEAMVSAVSQPTEPPPPQRPSARVVRRRGYQGIDNPFGGFFVDGEGGRSGAGAGGDDDSVGGEVDDHLRRRFAVEDHLHAGGSQRFSVVIEERDKLAFTGGPGGEMELTAGARIFFPKGDAVSPESCCQ